MCPCVTNSTRLQNDSIKCEAITLNHKIISFDKEDYFISVLQTPTVTIISSLLAEVNESERLVTFGHTI